MTIRRSFVLIPAAGHSVRMGRPKLLLPVAGQPLILHTLAAWRKSRVERIVVVIRPGDVDLADTVRAAGIDVVVPPAPPPDMKSSLLYGLAHIAESHEPTREDCWLVAPADMPGLSPRIADRLLDLATDHPGQILIPTLADRRGHPVLLPWSLADEVPRLAENEGLNALIDRWQPRLIACDDLEPDARHTFADIDTPQDLGNYIE
jgi:molybdenum cofactor cytidylyltransferase